MPYAATIPVPTSRTLAGKSKALSSTPPDLGNGCCCLAAFCCCLAAFCSCLAALRAAFSSGLCCAIVGAAPATITMAMIKPTLRTITRRLTEILPPPAVCRFNSNLHSYPTPYQKQRTSKQSEDPIRFPVYPILGKWASDTTYLVAVLCIETGGFYEPSVSGGAPGGGGGLMPTAGPSSVSPRSMVPPLSSSLTCLAIRSRGCPSCSTIWSSPLARPAPSLTQNPSCWRCLLTESKRSTVPSGHW